MACRRGIRNRGGSVLRVNRGHFPLQAAAPDVLPVRHVRALGVSLLLLLLSSPAVAQASRDDGVRAFAAGDYPRAAAILRPLAEDADPPDHAAAFLVALLYASGRGVSGNPIAACGLFAAAAATPGPFAEPAAQLGAALHEETPRIAEFCAGNAWKRMLGPSNIPPRPGGPASLAGDGYVAAAHDDMTEAVRVTRPVGESDIITDPAAQFLMAAAYQSGRGAPRDDLRACALYARAANDQQTAFGELSSRLMRTLWRAHDNEWFANCQALANLGLDHRFEPVTLSLGLGYDVEWDFAGATITYQGSSRRFRLPLAPRGAAFLPLAHTTLYTGRARTKRDFVSLLFWEPAGGAWALRWFLFEVTPDGVTQVGGAERLATRDHRPAATDLVDPDTLVTVRVNEYGMAEWAVLDPARPQARTIESAEDRRLAREEKDAKAAAMARVDWSRTFDPMRLPQLRYASDRGCGDIQLVGVSDDRGEAIVVHIDTKALALTTAPAVIDVAREPARVSIVVHVSDRPLQQSAFCTDVGQTVTEETWRAVSGRLTVELSPRGVDVRSPSLYRATIRLEGAEFVNGSGRRVRQTAPIVLSALAGMYFG